MYRYSRLFRLLFGAKEGDPEEQVAERSDYEDEKEDDEDNIHVRALNARRAELEDMRLRRRLLRQVKQHRAPSERPQELHAQCVDYAQPPADRAPLGNLGDADADDEEEGEAGDEADGGGEMSEGS